MADGSAGASVLRRKLAGDGTAAQGGRLTPARALERAFIQAAEEAAGLVAAPRRVELRRVSLDELCQGLPENPLLSVLKGPEERCGLVVFDVQSLAALIEAQTTGRVVPRPAAARSPTRTDALLAAGFTDLLLELFHEFTDAAEMEAADMVAGLARGFCAPDARAVALALPEITWHLFELEVDFGDGAKNGMVSLALPPPAPRVRGGAGGADWQRGLEKAVCCATAELDAVLARKRMALGAVARLRPGARILLPAEVIERVRLIDLEGREVSLATLGQADGFRAVMLSGLGCERGGEMPEEPPEGGFDAAAPAIRPGPPALPGPETPKAGVAPGGLADIAQAAGRSGPGQAESPAEPAEPAEPPGPRAGPDRAPGAMAQPDAAAEMAAELPALSGGDAPDLPELPELPEPAASGLPDLSDLPDLSRL